MKVISTSIVTSFALAFFVFAALTLPFFTSAQGNIAGSSSWAVQENMISELEIRPNISAPFGGICGFNFDPSAGNMICNLLGRPVPPGKNAGILLAPHGDVYMYISGITCPAGSSNFGNCTLAKFDPAGRACDPKFGIGLDCTATDDGPAITFFTYFKPISALLTDMNDFLFYFKNALVTRLNIAKQRIRVMDIYANMTSGIVNVTWRIQDPPDTVSTTREYAEFQFTQQCNADFFGTSLNLVNWHYVLPPTPAPPNHDFSSWSFRLAGGSKAWIGRFEIKTSATAQWGTSCGTGWTMKEAECACNTLGFTFGYPIPIHFYGGGTGPIVMWNVDCYGATLLQNCAFTSILSDPNLTTLTCSHNDDVGIDCYQNMDPPITPTPGTASPPIYNGTIIGWNATIYKGTFDRFKATVGNGLYVDATRVIVINTYSDSNWDYVFFRFTDAPSPFASRFTLDYELSVIDDFELDLVFGIVHLTNNVTGTTDDPASSHPVPDYWSVKLVTTGALAPNAGLVNIRPKNASGNAVPWGTVCTGIREFHLSAQAFCKSAGVPATAYNAGGLIPYYKTAGSGPIYMMDASCNLGAYVDNCTYTKCETTGLCPACNHNKDMGVICFKQATAPQATVVPTGPFSTTLYTILLTNADYTQLPIKMASYLPMAYDRFTVTFQQDGPAGTTLKFYFSDPVPDELFPAPASIINSWFQSISAAGKLALFNIKSVSWTNSSITPAPTPVPIGHDELDGFKFRIRKLEEEIRYNEIGLIEVQRPGATTWGTVCNNDFSFVEAFAMCVTLGYPTPNPTFRSLSELFGSNIPTDIQAQPITITHAYCPTISYDDTIRNCSVTFWETNTYSCSHGDDVVIDCYDTNRKLPAIEFRSWIPLVNYTREKFLEGFHQAFNISAERVVVTAELPKTSPEGYQFMYVYYYFIDDWTVFADDGSVMPPGSISSGGGSKGGMSFAGARDAKVQDIVVDVDEKKKKIIDIPLPPSLMSEQVQVQEQQQRQQQDVAPVRSVGVKPGPWVVANANYRARRQAFAQETYTQPPGSTINYDEFTRAQIDWSGKHWMYAAGYQALEFEMWLFNPSELWKYFQSYEIRRNSTRPNGPILSDETTWKYQLAATMHQGLNHTRCQAQSARCYGRVEVQMGETAPWGTVCSVGSTDDTALTICRKFNPVIQRGLIIPTYVYGQGLIALSDIACPPVSTNPTIEQCAKKRSDHAIKRNLCNHNMDMGVMCGVDIAPRLQRASIFELTFDFTVFNTSWFPYTFAAFTGLDSNRIRMWDGKNVLWYEYWNLDGLPAVKLNMTFTDAPKPGDYTREDLELYFQLHSPWGLYELYGIIEYVNHGPVPLHVNATRVTSYVPFCNRTKTNGTCANETQAPPLTTMYSTASPNTLAPPPTTAKASTTTTTAKAPSSTTTTAKAPSSTTTTAKAPSSTTKAASTATTTAATATKAPSTTAGAPTVSTIKPPTSNAPSAQTSTSQVPQVTTTAFAPTSSGAPSSSPSPPSSTPAPSQAPTASQGASTEVTPSTQTVGPSLGPSASATTGAPSDSSTSAAAPSLPGSPSSTASPPSSSSPSPSGASSTSAATSFVSGLPTVSSTTAGGTQQQSSSAPVPGASSSTSTFTSTSLSATSPSVTTVGSVAPTTSSLAPPSQSTTAAATTATTAAAATTTTTPAPAQMKYMINFEIPSNASAPTFVKNLSDLLHLSSTLPYTITSQQNSASTTQTVQVTFPDEPTQQRALNLPQPDKDSLSIVSAAATDEPLSASTPSSSPGSNIPVIAGAAGGGLLLVVIIAVVVFKKKSAANSNVNKSGPIDLDYSSMMTDTFDAQELHLQHHHSPRESASVQV